MLEYHIFNQKAFMMTDFIIAGTLHCCCGSHFLATSLKGEQPSSLFPDGSQPHQFGNHYYRLYMQVRYYVCYRCHSGISHHSKV